MTSRTSCRHTVCPHTRSSHASVSYETSSKSHASRLQDERFVRDFLQKSVRRQVSKTSVSSKSHTASLQNERFVRDFLQKSRVKSPKRALRTRLPPKVTRQVSKTSVSYETSSKTHGSTYETSSKSQAETPIGAHTSRSPATQFRESSPSKQHPLTRQSQCDSDIHLHLHNLTIPCACHENRTSTPQNTHKLLRLPRKMTISSHVSFHKIYTAPHVWNDFDPF